MPVKVGVLVGSLSKESINRRLAKALKTLAPDNIELIDIDIADLPLYNRDADADYPQVARDFKAQLNDVDALLYVTPEYNRSIPSVLKNAIDWASRPWGQNSLGKPSATIGASMGPLSTAVAQQHLKQILVFSNAPLMGQPEGYIHFTPDLISEDGTVNSPETREFLANWINAYAEFVYKNLS